MSLNAYHDSSLTSSYSFMNHVSYCDDFSYIFCCVKMLSFTYVDYLLLRYFFWSFGFFGGPMSIILSSVLVHGQPSCLPCISRLTILSNVIFTACRDPSLSFYGQTSSSMVDHPLSISYKSCSIVFSDHAPCFHFFNVHFPLLSSFLSYSPISKKMMRKVSRKPVQGALPTSFETFISPGSKRIYDNVRGNIKLVRESYVQPSLDVFSFFSLLGHFEREPFVCISEDVYEEAVCLFYSYIFCPTDS